MKVKTEAVKQVTHKRILRTRNPIPKTPVSYQPVIQATEKKMEPKYLREYKEYKRQARERRANAPKGKYLKEKYYCDRCIEEVCRLIFKTTKEAKGQQTGIMTKAEAEEDARRPRYGRTARHRTYPLMDIPFSNYEAHVVPYELTKMRVCNRRTGKKRSELRPPKVKSKKVTKPTTTIDSRGLKYAPKTLDHRQEFIQHLKNICPEKDVIVILARTNYNDREAKASFPTPHDLHTDLIVVYKPRRTIYYLAPAPLDHVRRDDAYRKKNKDLVQRTIIQELRKHIPGVKGFGVESEIQMISDGGGSGLFMGLRGCAFLAENGMPDPRVLRKEVYLREEKKLDRETVTVYRRYYERLFEEAYLTCEDTEGYCNRYLE